MWARGGSFCQRWGASPPVSNSSVDVDLRQVSAHPLRSSVSEYPLRSSFEVDVDRTQTQESPRLGGLGGQGLRGLRQVLGFIQLGT